MHRERSAGGRRRSVRGLLRSIGPELVSAASDNDPTNVGTAAAVGAQAGYQLCWVAVLVAPLLGVVLTIAAHVGAVARDDLQSLTLKRTSGRDTGHHAGLAPAARQEALDLPEQGGTPGDLR